MSRAGPGLQFWAPGLCPRILQKLDRFGFGQDLSYAILKPCKLLLVFLSGHEDVSVPRRHGMAGCTEESENAQPYISTPEAIKQRQLHGNNTENTKRDTIKRSIRQTQL